MSKIVLNDTAGGYNLQNINTNFQRIEDELNNKVLYRDVPVGEPNAMSNDLDMNSKRVYNLPEPLSPSEAARLQDVQNAISGANQANLISFTPIGDITSTTVQGAIAEVDAELHSHINDTAGAHLGSAISFTQAGVGAIVRDAQSKLRETVSVTDFGAVGDGVTDDTAAIQSAVTSRAVSPYGAVFLPAGRYKISAAIVVPRGVSMYGDGALASVLECYNCDGVTITPATWDQGMQFFEDFGISSMAGDNFSGFVSFPSNTPGVTQDGFYLNRLKFFDWNIGIFFGATYQSIITNCSLDRINTAIYVNGDTEGIYIKDNQLVCTGGGRGVAAKIGVFIGSPSEEAILVKDNYIYGFETCIDAHDALFCIIEGNTFLAISGTPGITVYGIKTSGTKDHITIANNLIEGVCVSAGQTFVGVYCQPVNTTTDSVTVIESNRIFDSGGIGTTSVGVQVNAPSLSLQNNIVVQNNDFAGFSLHDILVYNPNNVAILQNKCRSNVPTHNIRIQDAVTAPVFVERNVCLKSIYVEPVALTDGRASKLKNSELGVYTPPDLYDQTWVPADGSGAGLAFTVASAKWSRTGYRSYVLQCDIAWPVTANGANAIVTGLPAAPSHSGSGGIGYSTVGAYVGWQHSTSAQFGLFDAAGVPKTNATMSGKRILLTIPYISA